MNQFVIDHGKKVLAVIFGAVLNAIALNFFLVPANVYMSGLAGIAQLVSKMSEEWLHFHVTIGTILLALNIPVAILGWFKVGKTFTFYSFLSVLLMSLATDFIPVKETTDDLLLYAVFGGVTSAIGVGVALKFGTSTGGLDIVAMMLSRMTDKPIGQYLFLINAGIIAAAGYLFGQDRALYTLVATYVATRVIDTIHTRFEKLTVMIVTQKSEEMKRVITERLVRGITELPARGAFTNEARPMLMMVVTRYELYDIRKMVHEVDPESFTNIVQTTDVWGNFRKD